MPTIRWPIQIPKVGFRHSCNAADWHCRGYPGLLGKKEAIESIADRIEIVVPRQNGDRRVARERAGCWPWRQNRVLRS
jgi:hypothetical protein